MADVRRKILVVDDVDFNRQIASVSLRAMGHEVDLVESGEAAIEAVQRKPYDLILMDVRLPGMDGVTATREIRRLGEKYTTLPIVALTANVHPDQIASFRDAGMDGYLAKPFGPSQLAQTIARLGGDVAEMFPAQVDDGFDPEVYAQLGEVFDRPEMVSHLDRLHGLIDQVLSGENPADDLERFAHQLVSIAGFLGFLRLSDLCHELETICSRGGDIQSVYREVCRVGREAIQKIGELRQAA